MSEHDRDMVIKERWTDLYHEYLWKIISDNYVKG